MPTANEILLSLQFLANKYVEMSIAWHVIIVFVIILAIYNKKINTKLYLGICGFLFLSVSLMAAIVMNPFNFLFFLLLAIVFLRKSLLQVHSHLHFKRQTVSKVFAYLLILSGLIYPHFLGPEILVYFMAAPVGIIPCPTLLVTSGLTLLFTIPDIKLNYFLIPANVFYGAIGVFFLAVTLDIILLLAAIIQFSELYKKGIILYSGE
jgi:hypothetical protein